jgi:type III secretory pathway component EscT
MLASLLSVRLTPLLTFLVLAIRMYTAMRITPIVSSRLMEAAIRDAAIQEPATAGAS